MKEDCIPKRNKEMKSIPISKIDALIQELETIDNITSEYCNVAEVIVTRLKEIKKEAIVPEGNKPLSSLTCPWCGLEAITTAALANHMYRIENFVQTYDHWYRLAQFISSKQSGNKPLEQRILQRIKEVESMTGGGEITRKSFLDELRKLLE